MIFFVVSISFFRAILNYSLKSATYNIETLRNLVIWLFSIILWICNNIGQSCGLSVRVDHEGSITFRLQMSLYIYYIDSVHIVSVWLWIIALCLQPTAVGNSGGVVITKCKRNATYCDNIEYGNLWKMQ